MADKKENLQSILSKVRGALSSMAGREKQSPPQEEVKEQAKEKTKEKEIDKSKPVPKITEAKKEEKIVSGGPPKEEAKEVEDARQGETKEPEAEVKEEYPPGSIVVKYACFYPLNQANHEETFTKHLTEVVKKTSKKPFFMKSVFKQPIDPFNTDWEKIMATCKEKTVEAIFLIHPEGFDPKELKNKFATLGVIFQSILTLHLDRRMTYIDLVIELMLAKKT